MSDSIAFIWVVGLLVSVSMATYGAWRIVLTFVEYKYPERSESESLTFEDDEVDTTKVVSGKS